MRRNVITTLAITAATAVAGLAPAAGLADATRPGQHTPSQAEIYFYVKPNQGWSGTLTKGQIFKVKRFSPSGKYAYGLSYAHSRHGWVSAAELDPIAVTKIKPGDYTPAQERIYVSVRPNQGWSGTLTKGQTFRVKRLSPSGKYAYGMAYGHMNRHGWVAAADLKCK